VFPHRKTDKFTYTKYPNVVTIKKLYTSQKHMFNRNTALFTFCLVFFLNFNFR